MNRKHKLPKGWTVANGPLKTEAERLAYNLARDLEVNLDLINHGVELPSETKSDVVKALALKKGHKVVDLPVPKDEFFVTMKNGRKRFFATFKEACDFCHEYFKRTGNFAGLDICRD